MYNSSFLSRQTFNSVISDGCDLSTAFKRVLSYFDPNKGKNFRSKILDCSYSLVLLEKDSRLFHIDKTKNLTGSVKEKQYDIIVYEPPRNQNFCQDASNSSKFFSTLLKHNGIVIVKMNDFKEKGSNRLQGSFEVWDIFSDAGLYLFDNIVYNFFKPSNTCEVYDRAEIIHLYFMIFKKGEGK